MPHHYMATKRQTKKPDNTRQINSLKTNTGGFLLEVQPKLTDKPGSLSKLCDCDWCSALIQYPFSTSVNLSWSIVLGEISMLKYIIVDATTLIVIFTIFGLILYMRRRRIVHAHIRGKDLADTYSGTSCLLEIGSILFLLLLLLILIFSSSVAVIDTPEKLLSLQMLIQRLNSMFFNTITLEVVATIFFILASLVSIGYLNCVRRQVINNFQESRDIDEVKIVPTERLVVLKEKLDSLDNQIKSMEFHDRQDIVKKLQKHRNRVRHAHDRLMLEILLKRHPKFNFRKSRGSK